jgi:lysophospholipase L1-like esterase
MFFERGEKIVFIGASLTDCGRRDTYAPYGNGYMSLVRALVDARYPELALRWVNNGIGGDTVRHLSERWDQDAIAEQPDWLSIQLPTNDVWRFFGDRQKEGVPIDEYATTVHSLFQRAVDAMGCRLIVLEPTMIEADRTDPMRKMIDEYGEVARGIAAHFDAIWVNPQTAWDRVLKSTPSEQWSADRVHPDLPGHAVVALAFLRAIGFALN